MSNIVLHSVCEEDGDGDGLNILGEMVYGTIDGKTDSDGDGLPDGLEVQLVKNPDNPNDVHGFDLTMAFWEDKNDEITIGGDTYQVIELIEKLEDDMKSISNLLLDLTDGYFYINSITIFDEGSNGGSNEYDNANIRISEDIDGHRYQHVPYDIDTNKPFYVQLIYSQDMLLDTFEKMVCHELGHYLFWLGEEYKDSNGDMYDVIYCDWEAFEIEKISLESIMCRPSLYSEFSTYLDYHGADGWLNNRDSLERDKGITIYDTDQYNRLGESCWETIFKMCNTNNGRLGYVDFDLDHDGISDNEFYNNHRPNPGPINYDIGQYLIINQEY